MKKIFLPLFIASITIIGGCDKDCPAPSCSVDLQKNLIAYYPFNGNANDVTGNGNNGTPMNGAFFTTDLLGRPNHAAGFDGINDYIIVNDNGKLNADEITISMMVMANSTNRRHAILARVDFQTGRSVSYGVGQALDATNRWEFPVINGFCSKDYVYNPQDYATSSSTLQAGQWYHLLVTFSKGQQKLYVDGQLKASMTRSFDKLDNCTLQNLVIGGWWKNDIVSIDGKIDELRIYNRVLTDCEIEDLTDFFQE